MRFKPIILKKVFDAWYSVWLERFDEEVSLQRLSYVTVKM